ncbi:hypothetical protein E2C01_061139 [Portunus trituberculatus]|uniref:Uncharacterized protein n=1 Tax=Portunus trituberculatus TaxID=210409 RepID=A0A5B7HDK0_PORTR|nr:hypothetical protein [Portunus trituberculatus]
MAGVMYQGYASYLQAYQRHSNPYCPSNPLALNHYDKVMLHVTNSMLHVTNSIKKHCSQSHYDKVML